MELPALGQGPRGKEAKAEITSCMALFLPGFQVLLVPKLILCPWLSRDMLGETTFVPMGSFSITKLQERPEILNQVHQVQRTPHLPSC